MSFFMQPAVASAVRDAVTPQLGRDVARLTVDLMADVDKTVTRTGSDEIALVTGDIPATWLRDSCAQVAPFLRVADHLNSRQRARVTQPVSDMVRRHWRMIAVDPYANAFQVDPRGRGGHPWDRPKAHPIVWERKFELDSLAFPITVQRRLIELGDTSSVGGELTRALRSAVEVYQTETEHERRSRYRFVRPFAKPSDTLARWGKGEKTKSVGLIWSGFRPSDDACELGFNIPGNAFAAKALDDAAWILEETGRRGERRLSKTARHLASEVRQAIARHGVAESPTGDRILAYETDGAGHHLTMDDANLPSLLGLPYLNALPDEVRDLYPATRRFVLSRHNPWYFSGSALTGVGSPHTGPRRVWPIAVAVEGLTSNSADKRERLIEMLLRTTNGTRQMHEGIDPDDPSQYSREWFSWANAMFCELVLFHCGL